MDLRAVRRQIERGVNKLSYEFGRALESILTEHDLRCRLDQHLRCLARMRQPSPSRIQHLPSHRVHHDLPWFDENWKLRIRPDITILDPAQVRIQCSDHSRIADPFSGGNQLYSKTTPLPSKQFEFDGKAITIELKFARSGITPAMARLIRQDFQKMKRLFLILDGRDDGDSVFSYLVIFNRLQQPPWQTPLAKFLTKNKCGSRHRILYRTWKPLPKWYLRLPGHRRD